MGLKLNLMKLHNYIQRERERERRWGDNGIEIINNKMTCFPKFAIRSYIVSQRERDRGRQREMVGRYGINMNYHEITCFPKFALWGYTLSQRERERERGRWWR